MTVRSAKKLAKVLIQPNEDVYVPHAYVFSDAVNGYGLCTVCSLSRDNSIHARPEPEKRVVLMLNDFPIAVKNGIAGRFDAAAEVEWKKREPQWKELGLKMGECCHEVFGGKPVPFTKYHYHTYEFVVDGEARL